MFFNQDLLSKRDSGFGLLWLAATLGSKSAIKKLPKRQIQAVDISQLCHLICEPNEPLALRLSSNLLVGVVRVFKVKQELLMNDVNTCFVSLKKVVHEHHLLADSHLELPQSSVRPSAVTLATNPQNAVAIDFDALVADWDEYLNLGECGGDEDFDPGNNGSSKKRSKATSKVVPPTIQNHTLEENHDHLLSNSLDFSFIGAGFDGSFSSQNENFELSFRGEDPILMPSDDLDVGLLADELARELGWEACVGDRNSSQGPSLGYQDDGVPMDLMDMDMPLPELPGSPGIGFLDNDAQSSLGVKRKADDDQAAESISPLFDDANNLGIDDNFGLSPKRETTPVSEVVQEANPRTKAVPKRLKMTRLLLDTRTELTDDELKTARAKYLEGQEVLKRGLKTKEYERVQGKRLEEMVRGAPEWIRAPVLANFWQEVYRVQVDSRSGDEPAKKRRRVQEIEYPTEEPVYEADFLQTDFGIDEPVYPDDFYMRSSEEPGQGRRGSRTPSVNRDMSFALGLPGPNVGSESQKSSLFPWDHAGISSSGAGGFDGFVGSDPHIGEADVQMRSSSYWNSPLHSGLLGNPVGLSPAPLRGRSQSIGEDYAFDVADPDRSAESDTQQSDANLLTLEKNSYNFLEYAKMQSQSLPSGSAGLTFDTVVPQLTSTRHVAASAFYHCLVLATKDLLHVEQKEPYGPMIIRIV